MEQKPHTHVLWLQLYQRGKFRGWYKAGYGRIETDPDGKISAHNFQHMTTIGGWNGYSLLLPIGDEPPTPQTPPKRPASPGEDGDETLALYEYPGSHKPTNDEG
jgi:hypothetical protein